METRTVIVLPRGKVKQICKAEGVGKTTVYAALNGTSHSDNAERIRQLALSSYGGMKTKKLYG